jgi:rubrerythrin
MTPQQVVDKVVSFEKNLAEFYESLLSKPGLEPLGTVCRFMAQHSAIHAELIANYRSDAAIPQLEINPLGTLHDRLQSRLVTELENAKTLHDAMETLATAETILSHAYAKIADHYDDVSATYGKIAHKFRSLSKDEELHSDYIRKEQKRLGVTVSMPGKSRK